ncbi:MAG: hypothetical protein AAFO88_04255 [Pseudomonadota bacterium]
MLKPSKPAPEKAVVAAEAPQPSASDAPAIVSNDDTREAPSEAERAAWLERDVVAVKEAFDTYTQRVASPDARRAVFIASHNLRGTATPFGNPVLERLAGSLCTLLEKTSADEPVVALANLHVEAMRAALVAGPGAASDELAQSVCVALEDQVKSKTADSV